MHLEIDHSGSVRPCCVFDGIVGSIGTQTIKEVFDNHSMISLRHDFIEGKKPEGCHRCWTNEISGLTSNRQFHVNLLKKDLLTSAMIDPKITSVDIKPGNTCNFKCRICNPQNSSMYAIEQAQYLKIPVQVSADWVSQDQNIDQLIELLPTLNNIDMYGGEPFLIKKFNLFLEEAVAHNHAHHIRLHYNTNGSIFPTQLVEYWKHFQSIDIQISIDNIKERFELERGGKWTDVENNIKQMSLIGLPNLKISIMPAINVMNVFYIGELLEWANQLGLPVNPIYVHVPHEFSIKNLTKHAKEILNKKYQNCQWPEMQNILKTINTEPNNDGALFIDTTRHFDMLRNENFAKTHPEIANAMGYVYNKDL
jgi:MoaA/NifB/PqqE/SkfB family radical SAM enzyme